MEDAKVMSRIDELAREEHELFEKEASGKATDITIETSHGRRVAA